MTRGRGRWRAIVPRHQPVTFGVGRVPVLWVHGVLWKRIRAQFLDLLGGRRGWHRIEDDLHAAPRADGREDADASGSVPRNAVVPGSVSGGPRSGPTPDRCRLYRGPGRLDGGPVRKARTALLVGNGMD